MNTMNTQHTPGPLVAKKQYRCNDFMNKNWTKCPSVTRSGRFFYHNHETRSNVVQSFLTGLWSIDGKGAEFLTAQDAMFWRDQNAQSEKAATANR